MRSEGDLLVTPKKTLQLDQAQQRRLEIAVERAANHRGITLSLKFKQEDIDRWKAAAEASKKNLTDWIEAGLNKLADRCLDK